MSAAEHKQTEAAPQPRSLVRKLSEVMAEVERVAKNGRNDFHKYDYATESDISAAVRNGLASRHLVLVPDVTASKFDTIETKSGKQTLCTLTVKFTVKDGDSGEEFSFTVLGQGQDGGDKATYKAMTGAEKYALLKLFLIPTGDDPEQDEKPAKHSSSARRPPLRAAPLAPADDVATLETGNKTRGIPLTEFPTAELERMAREATTWLEKWPDNVKSGPGIRRDLAKLTAELAARMAT